MNWKGHNISNDLS